MAVAFSSPFQRSHNFSTHGTITAARVVSLLPYAAHAQTPAPDNYAVIEVGADAQVSSGVLNRSNSSSVVGGYSDGNNSGFAAIGGIDDGNYIPARTHFQEALALSNGSRESVALALCGESAVLRAMGRPNLLLVANALYDAAATRLPYPTLVVLLTELAQTAGASGLMWVAALLYEEAQAARDAAFVPGESGWSASLAVMRARAACSPGILATPF